MPTITGTSGDDTITDTSGNDTILALEGDDTISARGPLDHVDGGPGLDRLIVTLNRNRFNVPHYQDEFADNPNGGADGIYYMPGGSLTKDTAPRIQFTSIDRIVMYFTSESSYDISTWNGDDIIYTGTGQEGAHAQGGNDILIASGGPDRLYGGPGDDVYYVNYFLNQTSDSVVENPGEGFDIVYTKNNFHLPQVSEVEWIQLLDRTSTGSYFFTGSTTFQTILANNGNNSIDGRGGGDALYGYLGDDIYYVSSWNDVAVEADGEGFDTVYSSVDYILPSFTSVEWLQSKFGQGAAGVNLTGNQFSQTVVGDKGDNHLDGNGGGDVLNGYLGNDTYVINASNDVIFDFAGQGTFDSVYARVSYALAAGVEIEYLTAVLHVGADAIDLAGNSFAQTIYGNAGANRLDGNGGGDVLRGFGGDDLYMISSTSDVVIEAAGEGTEVLYSRVSYVLGATVSVEFVSTVLHAATTAIDLAGNGFDQTVSGNAGVNRLDGGGGNDILNGFGGNDAFVFTASPVAGNRATLTDFLSGADRLELDDSVFSALAPGALAAGAFVAGTAAQDADDRILFDAATGAVYYDSDGNGAAAAVQFATLQSGATLTSADIFVI